MDDLIALMSAYRDVQTKNVKLQILSIYTYRHTMKKTARVPRTIRESELETIKMANAHGSGSIVLKVVNHSVCLDTGKVKHFVDFINYRPYFYQDVTFGTLTLDDGRQATIPNIVCTITRSTMIKQYLYCKEESFQPISHSTMYRILGLREASQQKSLSGIDNTA
jgi:Fe2+ or Zn2+ uptake regulation protein